MPIIHEWFCAQHGEFEGSHPICPHLGCDSAEVVKEHRTPPKLKSDTTKRTDAGLKRTAEMYGQSNFKSAREGESSKANSRADGMLWGDQAAQFIGKPLTQAHQEVAYTFKDKEGKAQQWVDRGGMRTVASEVGITQRVLPAAEVTIHEKDSKAARKS